MESMRCLAGMRRLFLRCISEDWRSWPREIESDHGIEFVLIEPGAFDMGSESDECMMKGKNRFTALTANEGVLYG